MTVDGLIKHLENYRNTGCNTTTVICFDADTGTYITITGFLLDPVNNTLRLETDNID